MNSKRLFYTILSFFLMMPLLSYAQGAEEKLVEFFSTNATMEDNPKQHSYNITIFSPDGAWKMQLNYKADSMFGTFTNDDFDLKGSGKNYNYARNPKNDMVFYSFTDMNVTVTDEGNLYRVKANCLTNNNTRFVVEATIDAPQPSEVRTDNLGYARLEPNAFYGTWTIRAENDNYKLGYGVVGEDILGTFYRADMLMPELYDKRAGKQINVLTATALHTKNGDNTDFKIDILGDDHVLYSLTMFNGPFDVQVKEEKTLELSGLMLQDLTEMYGCYQFGAMSEEYGVAIALKPDALSNGRTSWGRDDIIMQYTQLTSFLDNTSVEIFDINAELLKGEDNTTTLKADVLTIDGVMYHVSMYSTDAPSVMPEPKDTVNIDFGHVRMIDYTQGMGTVGLGAVVPDKYQMRFYLNTPELNGEFINEDFIIEMCDIMVVTGDTTYVFHDGKYMTATMEKVDGQIRITADMYCVDEVLYHATMYIDPMKCLEGGDYSIDYDNGVDMVSINMTSEADYAEDGYNEFWLQFQNLENVFDEYDNIVGDGYNFSFYFAHEGPGVSGEYGYSAGTLAEDDYHQFFENKCEVRVAPVAGTLTLEPVEPVSFRIGIMPVRTYLYKATFQWLGQNGAIYRGEGSNILLCINEEGDILSIDESASAIIKQTLEDNGYRVRKVMKDGKIIIEKGNQKYDLQGRVVK